MVCLQQDNDLKHTSKLYKNYLEKKQLSEPMIFLSDTVMCESIYITTHKKCDFC